MERLLSPFKQGRLLNVLFLSNVFISVHYALIIYVNSSLLSDFFSDAQVSAIYIISSILSVFVLLNASRVLEKIGLYRFIITSMTLEILSTVGMVATRDPNLVALFFIIHAGCISLILFNMDVFVESVSRDESKTGLIRATYLTLTNIAIVLSPLFVAVLIKDDNYSYVYLLSAVFVIPLYYFMNSFKKIEAQKIKHIRVKETLLEYLKNKDLYNVFMSQFLLQLFYGIMVIYTPIYLEKYIGFSWTEIGLMFTIMLLPFVFFELPIGEMEDDKYGEKEFMIIGFVVMGIATIFMSFVTAKIFWIWAAVLFITRVGASFVETSTESYFFRHVDESKTDVISFFRVSRPLSFIVAPVIATVAFQFIPFQFIFILTGVIMLSGTYYSLSLNDSL